MEVVANFIYALKLYDYPFYEGIVKNSRKYIAGKQTTYGYWESKWYYGNHYGTYVCLRLLKNSENTFSPTIKRALTFIKETQKPDGGFGLSINEESDPLSTAFAILSLKLFFQKENLIILRAEKYLVSVQTKQGNWNEVDFIKPKVQEPYKSKTLTTAFVLNALTYEY